MKTDLFQSCDHSWVFQICWHIECSTFTASSFTAIWLESWNSQPQPQDIQGRQPSPLPPPTMEVEPITNVLSHSVLSDSLHPHWLQPTRLLCPWVFFRQESWNGLPFPLPGDLPDPGIKPASLAPPALQADYLPSEPLGKSSLSFFENHKSLTYKISVLQEHILSPWEWYQS